MHVPVVAIRNGQQPVFLVVSIIITKVAIWLRRNLRYDGSSRFLRDQRWNRFPSFSLGWNVAREAFFVEVC